MNDIPVPSNSSVIASTTAPIATMAPEAITAEYEVVQRQLAANTSPNAKGPLLARLERLAEARWPATQANDGKIRGDASAGDPKGEETYEKALKGELGYEEQQRAMNARDAQSIRAAQSENGMTEAEIAEMEKAYEPKGAHEYRFDASPGQEAKIAATQKLLFDNGVSPQVANLLIQGGDRLNALSDDAFSERTQDAVRIVKALPGGSAMVQDAHRFLTSLPDGHPLMNAAVIATASEAGIRELARLQRRKASA